MPKLSWKGGQEYEEQEGSQGKEARKESWSAGKKKADGGRVKNCHANRQPPVSMELTSLVSLPGPLGCEDNGLKQFKREGDPQLPEWHINPTSILVCQWMVGGGVTKRREN